MTSKLAEGRKSRTEINEIQNRKSIDEINETKSRLLEKITKVTNL